MILASGRPWATASKCDVPTTVKLVITLKSVLALPQQFHHTEGLGCVDPDELATGIHPLTVHNPSELWIHAHASRYHGNNGRSQRVPRKCAALETGFHTTAIVRLPKGGFQQYSQGGGTVHQPVVAASTQVMSIPRQQRIFSAQLQGW